MNSLNQDVSTVAEPPPSSATCCIVGAGPAGVMLAWLLARAGIAVKLLERHDNFDRDFRGDTLHPGVLEILDQLGLADQVLALPHARMSTLSFHTASGSLQIADLRCLKTRFPFVAMLSQARFLEFLVNDARRFPTFQFVSAADVQELIEENGVIRGVRFRDAEREMQEVWAELVVATDGRASKLRKLAGMEAIRASPEIDVLWFRIPRLTGQQSGGYLAPGGYMIVLDREDQWQVGYVILKGQYQSLREAGLDALRAAVARLGPAFAPSLGQLEWSDVRLLSVQADRLKTWHRPGLLFLGDAAHVMSPVGGVGINYAIQDAVEAANLLTQPLRDGRLTPRDLQRVQRRREWPTRIVQAVQAFDQTHLIERALRATGTYRLPLGLRILMNLPILKNLPSRVFAFGVRRVRVLVEAHKAVVSDQSSF